jgi:hypothetical protein
MRQGRSAKISPTVALSGIASSAASDLLGDLDDDTLRNA